MVLTEPSPWKRAWQPTPVFCLENPRNGGAWWAAVYRVAQSLGLVHWDDSEGWYGKGGGRGVQDGEHLSPQAV